MTNLTSPIKCRHGLIIDIPTIMKLWVSVSKNYIDDYQEEIDEEFIFGKIRDGELLVFTWYDYPIGVIWFTDTYGDLHTTLHAVFNPLYFKKIYKLDLLEKTMDQLFDYLVVDKINVETLETQKSGVKILKRLGFRWAGMRKDQILVNGRQKDVHYWELSKRYWRSKRNGKKGQKEAKQGTEKS